MSISVEGGWSDNFDMDFFFVFYYLFKGSFGLFKAYLVVFGLFLPKTKEEEKIKCLL